MRGAPRRGMAEGLSKRKNDQLDNFAEALPAKIALRREALEAVESPRVLDLFAGRGHMFDAVWGRADAYTGGDHELKQVLAHKAACYHADAEVLLRALDLTGWNIFDLDAYGSPWTEVTILAARRQLRPGERVAVVITDGAPRRAQLGLTAHALAALAGEDPKTVGAHRRWPILVRQAMEEAAQRMGGRLTSLRQADVSLGKHGMWYGLAVLQGAGPAPGG